MEGYIEVRVVFREGGSRQFFMHDSLRDNFWDDNVVELVDKISSRLCHHIFVPWTSIRFLEFPKEAI